MQETPQQYTERILGILKGKNPLTVLAATPGQLATLLRGVRRVRLAKRPSPEKWSAAEILGHLADSEAVLSFRLRLVLGSNGTPIQAFDQDAWAGFSRYNEQDPKLSLESFRLARARNVWLLKKIPRELWENYGIHSERGKETVKRIAEMMAGHDINHVAQIRQVLGK